jgi:hypothetical protein
MSDREILLLLIKTEAESLANGQHNDFYTYHWHEIKNWPRARAKTAGQERTGRFSFESLV